MQHLEADLTILEHIEHEPDTSQASLAERLGVAVGTINWHMQRLIKKGAIKVKRAERRKLHYIITPDGIALRARLTVDYLRSSFKLYRLVRDRSIRVIKQLKKDGIHQIQLKGNGDVAEICRLTCLEHGIQISTNHDYPVVKVIDLKIFIEEKRG